MSAILFLIPLEINQGYPLELSPVIVSKTPLEYSSPGILQGFHKKFPRTYFSRDSPEVYHKLLFEIAPAVSHDVSSGNLPRITPVVSSEITSENVNKKILDKVPKISKKKTVDFLKKKTQEDYLENTREIPQALPG